MWSFILDDYMEDNKLWRLLIVAFCIAVCVTRPGMETLRKDLPRFLLCWLRCAVLSLVVTVLLDMALYAAGGNVYLRMANEHVYLLVVFFVAMWRCGWFRSSRQFLICLSFVAACFVVGNLYVVSSTYAAGRSGSPSWPFLFIYALLAAYSILYTRFPLDRSSMSRGGMVLLAVMDTVIIVFAVLLGAYLLGGVTEEGYGFVDVFHFSAYAVFYCFLVVLHLSMYFICRERDAHARDVRETDLLRSTEDMKRFAEANMAQAREMRHDLKNQIAYMDALAKSGNYGELERTLDSLTADAMTPLSYVDCGNVEVSSILTMESVKARSHGFALEPLIVVPATLPFEGSDLCAILSNMCDNAIESNLRSGMDDPVEVRMNLRGRCLYIRVSNSLPEGTDAERVLSLETGKEDRAAHGLGTRIIREMAEKYGGCANFDVSGGKFIAEAELDMGPGAAASAAGKGE